MVIINDENKFENIILSIETEAQKINEIFEKNNNIIDKINGTDEWNGIVQEEFINKYKELSSNYNNINESLKTYIKYSNPDDLRAMPDTTMYQVFDLNRLYAILDDKDTVLIQYYIFDNILQPASFFLGRQHSYFAR